MIWVLIQFSKSTKYQWTEPLPSKMKIIYCWLVKLGGLLVNRNSKSPVQICNNMADFILAEIVIERGSMWRNVVGSLCIFYLRVFSFLETAWSRGNTVWSLESEFVCISTSLLINLVISSKLLNFPVPPLQNTPCSRVTVYSF